MSETQLAFAQGLRAYVRALGPLFRAASRRPQLVLFEYSGAAAFPGYLACWTLNIPYAVRLKGDAWLNASPREALGLLHRLKRRADAIVRDAAFSHAALILPISQFLQRSLRSKFPSTATRVVAIAAKEPAPTRIEQRNPVHRDFLLTVTNFNFWDKASPLIDVAANVASVARREGLIWVVLGDGPYLHHFRDAIATAGLADVVIAPGWRASVDYFPFATGLLYLSLTDGLPNVLLEAAAYGIPVVINEECPAIEFVQDRVTGCHVPLSDRSVFKERLTQFLTDKTWREALAANFKEYCRIQFSPRRVAGDLCSALLTVVSRPE